MTANLRLNPCQLIEDLRLALNATRQLRLELQPRVCSQTNRCVGAEALLRWRHPVFGALAPGDFIPLVERDPIIVVLTDWVLDQAMRFAAKLSRVDKGISISVNVAPANLAAGYFAGRLVERLSRHNVDASQLELEFTESELIADDKRTRQQLNQIRRMGFIVALDDFGAGYSNISYFRQVPVDVIKIDRSLIDMIGTQENGETIVKWVIGLARELRLRVVAEGIDSDQKAAALTGWGCDEGQGFAFALPMSPSNLTGWIRQRSSCSDQS